MADGSSAVAAVLESGTIKSVRPDKFGFVLTAEGVEAVFFPAECPLALGLPPGAIVQFYTRASTKGKRAFNVRPPCHHGSVKSYNPSKFGFILTTDGDEAIFYPKDIVPGHTVSQGDVVEFDSKPSKTGKQAVNVAKAGVPGFAPGAAPAAAAAISASPISALHSAVFAPTLPMHNRQWGTVKSYNPSKGFGFVVLSTGEEALLNAASLLTPSPLAPGDYVEFALQVTAKGKRAVHVTKLLDGPLGLLYARTATASVARPAVTGVATGVREMGTVKSYNPDKGFGFIYTAAGDEALVQRDQIEGMEVLQPSETVEYEILQSTRGKRAINVKRFKPY